jgi:hypothetical protein
MSAMSLDDIRSMTVQIERDFLANDVWQEFSRRSHEQHSLDIAAAAPDRWRAILDRAPSVGPRPTLLAPFDPFGVEMSTWIYSSERPQEFNVEDINGTPTGAGVGYVGTINGVHVYQFAGLSDRAILCSGQCLRSVTYQVLPDHDDVVHVSLEEGGNPEKSQFVIRTAQVLDWSNDPILEFTWPPTPSAAP